MGIWDVRNARRSSGVPGNGQFQFSVQVAFGCFEQDFGWAEQKGIGVIGKRTDTAPVPRINKMNTSAVRKKESGLRGLIPP